MSCFWYIIIFLSTETIEKARKIKFEEQQIERTRLRLPREEKPSLKNEEIMFDRILAYLKVRFPFNLGYTD